MNFKKILFSMLLAAGCLSAFAQETETYETFNHHWFVQAQGGAQYTLGEVKFNKLLSPNVQVAGGYQFTPVWALRLAVNGWMSRAGSEMTTGQYRWKWKYVAPMLDVTCDLTNWIGGYKKRLVGVGLIAGIGANIGFSNDEAFSAANAIAADYSALYGRPVGNDVVFLENLWDGTKARFAGRFGAYLDFHVCPRVDVGIELTANTLPDTYNSKKAGNTDWYFNALAGIRVNLGKLTKTATREKPDCGERIVEKIVEKPVEKIVYRDREPTVQPREKIRREIFFPIRGSKISNEDMQKIDDIVAYMQKYPEAKVIITSYADKGTGNAKVNKMYSERRAKVTYDALVKKGIAASRITTEAKGDSEQPFAENDKNRVSICVAE